MSIEKFGGRRFILTVAQGLGVWVLAFLEVIDGGVYATVVIATVGAYIAGNTAQKLRQIAEKRDA